MSAMRHDFARRYARNISMPEVGAAGQERLARAKVLAVGAGGLGSPLLLYLAAAGVGTLGVADGDRVELSNLQRQILHETADIGRLKAESARDALLDLNPEARVIVHPARLDASNIEGIIRGYDLVADGSDNFATRFLVNAACLKAKKTLISAAVIGFSGQLYTFKPYLGAPHPCYRCFCPEEPPPGAMPRCAESGVLGAVAGILGAWQAAEAVKELLGIGESLSGYMLALEALPAEIRKIRIPRDPECSCCGKRRP